MSPKAAPASDRAVRIAGSRSAGLVDDAHALAAATGDGLDDERIPDGATRGGDLVVSSRPASKGCSVPGTTGTPARMAAARAAVLLPMSAIASGDGPMKVRPASRQARANAAFSARNP